MQELLKLVSLLTTSSPFDNLFEVHSGLLFKCARTF